MTCVNRSVLTVIGLSFVSQLDDSFTAGDLYFTGLCDEDESMAVLPPESLCEWLRRMFGLTQDASRQYEKKIYLPHRKKTFAKVCDFFY